MIASIGARHARRRLCAVVGVVALVAGVLEDFAGAAAPPVAFGPKSDYAAGGAPDFVAVGDVNGDNAPDLAVANGGASSVSVLLGDGVGGFGAKTDFATGDSPRSVALVDLNGDTFVDLVTANENSSDLSVLLGDGAGGFGAKTDFATGDHPLSLAVGDLDGDTLPDAAVANVSSGTVAVLLGDGAGGFGARTDLFTGFGTWSVAIADFNGDTFLDLAVLNNGSSRVAVLLGNGAGGFGPKTDFATGPAPRSLAVGDLNGDHAPDLAVANGNPGGLSVLLGNGSGSFGAKTDFAADGVAYSVAIGDVNGDTFPDLIAAIGGASQVWVLPGDGNGDFTNHTGFATGSFPTSVTAGDVNGDARLDLVTTNFVSGNVSVLLNTTGILTVPAAPTIIRNAAAGHESAMVSWTAPIYDGGSPVIGYVVTAYVGYNPIALRIFDSTLTTQTVTGLTNGTQYRFRVQAYNAIGVSDYSKVSNPVIPAQTPPSAPTILPNATAGPGEATVSWTAPASDGGSPVIGYVVTAYVGYNPVKLRIFNSTLTTQTVAGLTNGTQYRFRVRAYNAIGVSGYSKVTNPVTPTG